jgi:hypothetical protein
MNIRRSNIHGAAYKYCMSCGSTKEVINDFEQCIDCYNISSRVRKYNPITGQELGRDGDVYSYTYNGVLFRNIDVSTPPAAPTVILRRNADNMGENKVKTIEVNESCHIPGATVDNKLVKNLNLMFMLDVTSSMNPYVVRAKEQIKNMTDALSRMYKNKVYVDGRTASNTFIQIRVAVIGYRDHCDQEQFIVQPFTCDVNSVYSTLSDLNTCGGGDIPEDVRGGFNHMFDDLNFMRTEENTRHNVSIAVLIADAPGHGSRLNNLHDNYENDDEGDVWHVIMNKMKQNEIEFQIVKLTHNMEKMIRYFQNLYDDDENYKIEIIDLADITDVNVRSTEMTTNIVTRFDECFHRHISRHR